MTDEITQPTKTIQKRHSKFGMASLIIGCAILALVGRIFMAPEDIDYTRFFTDYTLVTWCLVPILWLAELILAVIGLTRKTDRKLFPILGLIVCLLLTIPILFVLVFTLPFSSV